MHPVFALLLAAPSADLARSADAGLKSISPAALSAHVRFLADDALEGRGTGSRGHAVAARYLVSQLQAAGYAPAGENGTYFQAVPLVGMTVKPEENSLTVDGGTLRYPDDYFSTPRAGSTGDDVSGELVFAGYGVTAPEYGYDDVPEDLHGKIAVVIYGAPRSDRPGWFPTAASAVYSDSYTKARRLAAHGAVAMIQIFTPELIKHLPWAFGVRQTGFENVAWMEGDKPGSGYVIPGARMPDTMLQRLVAKSGHNAEQLFRDGPAGKLKPFPLGVRGHLKTSFAVRRFTSENVAAVLKGASSESVALTAHLDHLGVGPAMKGDTIYNGAEDNASGVSAVIELARAFAALPQRPPRSILVVGVTGEEKGLQGSDYYAQHPTVPIQNIVADVNLDGVGWFSEPFDLIALGAEHSSLARNVRAALEVMKMKDSPDPEPEQVFFIRSDQYTRWPRRRAPTFSSRCRWRSTLPALRGTRATCSGRCSPSPERRAVLPARFG